MFVLIYALIIPIEEEEGRIGNVVCRDNTTNCLFKVGLLTLSL